jgi:hypothetical protein
MLPCGHERARAVFEDSFYVDQESKHEMPIPSVLTTLLTQISLLCDFH